MTRLSQLLLLALSLLLLATVAFAGSLLLPRSPVTQANVDLIRPGMTRAEAEAVLGDRIVPFPGSDDEVRAFAGLALLGPADVAGVARREDGGRTATVFSGADGRALGATLIDNRPAWVPRRCGGCCRGEDRRAARVPPRAGRVGV